MPEPFGLTIVGIRGMRGRFEKMGSDAELLRIQLESAEVLAKKVEAEARTLAPRSKTAPEEGRVRFADSLTGHAAPTGVGFEVTLMTSQGDLRGWLRKGTPAHDIKAVNASALHFEVQGNEVFARSVHHPGTAANPWEQRLKDMVFPLAREEGGRIGSRLVKGLAGHP
jgi:hypothetical protein